VQQAYQHFKNGDIQSVLGLLSEDVEWTLFEIEGVPFSGTRRGPERVGEFFSEVFDTEEVLHFEPRELVAQGDKVVALGNYAWRVKSTGLEYETDFVHVLTMRDGKVARYQEFMDTAVVGAAYRGS
jgi:ketosteroid isomerase-like protein